jgi:type VI secretion system secreted protein Hcp
MTVNPSTPTGGSGADAFLHVQTKRAGKVHGEAASPGHADDIEVTGWQWGLSASSGIGGTLATSRRSYTALTIHKRIDAATTPLMSALATNDSVKEARLTLRRAGGNQEDFFIITLKDARIVSVQHIGDADGSTRESVGIAFIKVEVEYRPQKATGGRSGSTTFTDELMNEA